MAFCDSHGLIQTSAAFLPLNDAAVNAMGRDPRVVSVDRWCAVQLRLFFTVLTSEVTLSHGRRAWDVCFMGGIGVSSVSSFKNSHIFNSQCKGAPLLAPSGSLNFNLVTSGGTLASAGSEGVKLGRYAASAAALRKPWSADRERKCVTEC